MNTYNIIYELQKQSVPDNNQADWGLKEKKKFLLLMEKNSEAYNYNKEYTQQIFSTHSFVKKIETIFSKDCLITQ